jgi:ribosomal protein S7
MVISRFHCLVRRERCPGILQAARFVYHMLIERRRDLVRRTIVHRSHHRNHRTEANKLAKSLMQDGSPHPDSLCLRQWYEVQRYAKSGFFKSHQ